MINKQFSGLKLQVLPAYFQFLIENHLDTATTQSIEISRKKELPLLKLFANLSEQQLHELSKKGLKEFLLSVVEGNVIEKQKEAIAKWKENALEGIPQDRVQLADLIIVNSTRKTVFLNLVKHFTQDPETLITVAQELEELYSFIEYNSFNTYVDIHETDLRNLNLHLKEYQEELQVMNEELKESHEELQATNEELREQIEIRREIEEALEKERNFLKAILENIKDGIIACNHDGILNFFNEASKELHEHPQKDLPPRDWAHYYNLYHADGETLMRMEETPLYKAYKGESVKDLEMVVISSDGEKRTLLASGEKIKTHDGKNLGAVCVMHDITERKRLEDLQKQLLIQEVAAKEAKRQEQVLYKLFQEVPASVALLKGDNLKFTLINKHFQQTILQGRDLLDKPLLEALPELSGSSMKDLIYNVYTRGERFAGNEVPVDLDRGKGYQETSYFNFVFEPTFSVENKPDGIFVFAYEVTELINSRNDLQQLSNELAATNEELTAANEEIQASLEDLSHSNQKLIRVNNDLDNFVYTASHDLKAPIANIEGLVAALSRTLPSESKEKVENLITLIETSINRFKRTINDLTEVVKLQKEEEVIEEISFVKTIEEVQQDLSVVIEESKAKFVLENCESFKLKFSNKNFKSIIYNLVSNSLKYRSPERNPVIKISCYKKDEYQVISVADNGLGMDLQKESKIFSMFRRLHNHVEGSGIGLYIVKKIIENSGGRIEVESTVNEGSTFRVYLKSGLSNQ